jgi:hypothetical protein
MRIQPVQGGGMNAGYDASTDSLTISNEGNSPFIYVRVNNKIPYQGYIITEPGSGYDVVPSVSISGGTGTGATARALISNGSVDAIIPIEFGTGYTNPIVTIAAPTGEDGVQATATAVFEGSNMYHRFYDFYEVIWDGTDFVEEVGGLKADFASRESCPKMYSMPYDIDEPSNQGNFTGNIGVSGQGLVYLARLRGVDSTDGRDVYEFIRSLDPSSKVVLEMVPNAINHDTYYSANSVDSLDKSGALQGSFWAREINGSVLVDGRRYIGYYSGSSYDPYRGDPVRSDSRPIVSVVNSTIAGPTGLNVVTDVVCIGGSQSVTYATLFPSESIAIIEDAKKSFISLIDTPSSYSGAANYYLAVNPLGNAISFVTSPPSSSTVSKVSFVNLLDGPKILPTGDSIKLVKATSAGVGYFDYSFIQGGGSIVPNNSQLVSNLNFVLVNDTLTPGNNKYYGTNSAGVKGWHDLPGV